MPRYIGAHGIVFTLDHFQKTWAGYKKKLGAIIEATQEQEEIETWYVAIMYTHGQDISLVVDSEEGRDKLLKEINNKILSVNK